jgi:hypothetical protein
MTNLTTPVQYKHSVTTEQGVVRHAQAARTFYPVLKAARRIQSKTNRELALYVIQAAVDNADDTCVLEHAQPLTEWDAMFKGSAALLLACTTWACKFHGTVGQLRVTRNHLDNFFAAFGIVG